MPAREKGVQRSPVRMKWNKKSQMVSLPASSPDGKDLKAYIDSGAISPEMKPLEIRNKFPQFENYEYNTFAGSLRHARNLQAKQVKDR